MSLGELEPWRKVITGKHAILKRPHHAPMFFQRIDAAFEAWESLAPIDRYMASVSTFRFEPEPEENL